MAWVIAKDDRTVIINAHDAEYIDLCAVRRKLLALQLLITEFLQLREVMGVPKDNLGKLKGI